MATYVIGDIQGCFEPLLRLLEVIGYRPTTDRLWLVGDLVNRGPASLEVLRWAKGVGATTVLGNHELHLLKAGLVGTSPDTKDTFDDVLTAPDRDTLLTWLLEQPLMFQDGPWLMVHAGVPPQWTLSQAMALAREVERVLRSPNAALLLEAHRDGLDHWNETLAGPQRWATIVRGLTRIRCVTPQDHWDEAYAGTLDEIPESLMPWWSKRHRQPGEPTIVCGHWAAAGVYRDDGVITLDSGCVWGRELSALRLEDEQVFSVPADPAPAP